MNVILLRDEQLRARLLELEGEAPEGFYEDLWDGSRRMVARFAAADARGEPRPRGRVAALTSAAVHALGTTATGLRGAEDGAALIRLHDPGDERCPVLTVDAAPLSGYASPRPVPSHVIVNIGAPIGVTLPPPSPTGPVDTRSPVRTGKVVLARAAGAYSRRA